MKAVVRARGSIQRVQLVKMVQLAQLAVVAAEKVVNRQGLAATLAQGKAPVAVAAVEKEAEE